MKFATIALVLAFGVLACSATGPVVYTVSIRWIDDLPLWVTAVLSTIDMAGNVVDVVPIIPSIWGDDIYYPCERPYAASPDGTMYYYSVVNPMKEKADLYIVNIPTKKVTKVPIPWTMAGNNGQMLRSLSYGNGNLLYADYGNVLAFLNPNTGKIVKTVNIWGLDVGCNSTKFHNFDPFSNTAYVLCLNWNPAHDCQFVYGVNVATGKVTVPPCLPANRGISPVIAYYAGYKPGNSSYIMTFNANDIGPNIGLLNPTTSTWGPNFVSWEKFSVNKLVWNRPDTMIWDWKNGLFYVQCADAKHNWVDTIVTFDLNNNGHIIGRGVLTQTITTEGWALIPNASPLLKAKN